MKFSMRWLAAILLVGTSIGAAQSASTLPVLDANGRPLEFDVVSIREDKALPVPQSQSSPQFGPTPDGYRLKNVPLSFAILAAYVQSQGGDSAIFNYDQIKGTPEWIPRTRYDIDAKVSEADLPKWKDPALQPAMLRAMLQAMLADRFHLAVHRETIEQNVFELRVGKDGPKFTPSETTTLTDIQQKHPGAMSTFGGTIAANGSAPGQIMYFGMTMPALCAQLGYMAGRPIQDKTGLIGKYDVTYQIELPPPSQAGVSVDTSPDISAVMDQLGLNLVPAKRPVEILVIDHIERPTEN